MGFKEKTTKKYVLSKICNLKKDKDHEIRFYKKFYENLAFQEMDEIRRFNFLLKLCTNGWDYFVF